ncbi:MAG: HEPN domain-containing protein [Acidobacteriota bacterium]
MNRDDLKELTKIRLKEAKLLLDHGKYSGAYYLCGYIVECALKACIAKLTRRYDFPDKKRANESYTHNLSDLVKVAGLVASLNTEKTSDPTFEINWKVVITWDESSRYTTHGQAEAQGLYQAIADRRHGVLKWIKQHW